tara:strand:+ start:152 stop:526 length:375 start_codon:yes stop_codon:yes gene_type:complete
MTNARKELLEILEKFNVKLEAAVINIDSGFCESYELTEDEENGGFGRVHVGDAELKPNYTDSEYNKFMIAIDQNYNSGYGTQELSGVLWFTDGTWATRGEYDGSEWWEHHVRPDFNQMSNMYNN